MDAFFELLRPGVLVPWLLGMIFGVFVGATPGLTATMAVALILPISYEIGATAGLAMIIGVSFTAIFAGDIPATYLRIPGTPASAAAILDGHEMHRKGRGRLALTLDLMCSTIGGLIGVALLFFVAPQLARVALKFSNFEFFWLSIFGLCISALVSTGSTAKGLFAAAFGVLISTARFDPMYPIPRNTFRIPDMLDGIGFIPAMIGLFGLSEVLRAAREPDALAAPSIDKQERIPLLSAARTIIKHWWTVISSAVTGAFIGSLPGAGADIAAWGAYGTARQTSKRREEFGSGIPEGVIAPTSANNAAVAGAWIPALVFGIPGDAVTAIVLGAMTVYNIKPGPELFASGDSTLTSILLIALITQVLLIPAGLAGIQGFGWILRVPRRIVLVAVLLFSVVGAYSLQNSMFNVYVMLAFGIIGYFCEVNGVPLAPLVLGLILGPRIEDDLRTGLIKHEGDWSPFFTRPVCTVLVGILVACFIFPPVLRRLTRGGRDEREEKLTRGERQ